MSTYPQSHLPIDFFSAQSEQQGRCPPHFSSPQQFKEIIAGVLGKSHVLLGQVKPLPLPGRQIQPG